MDAVKFLKERKRMFKSGKSVPDLGVNVTYNSGKVVKLVEEWSAAHPPKTRQNVFLEQWPNAKLNNKGIVDIWPCCVEKNRKNDRYCTGTYCVECGEEFWMQEVE